MRSLHSGFGTALLPFLAMSAQASTDRALKSKSVRCCAVAGGPRSCPVDSWQRHSFLGGIRNPVRNGSHSETTRGRVKKRKKEKALKSHVFMREIHSPVAETPCILHKLLLRSVSHSLRSFLSGKLADSGGSGQRTQLNSEERVPSTSQRPFLFFFLLLASEEFKKTHTETHAHTTDASCRPKTDATGKFCAQSVRTVVLHVVLFFSSLSRHTTLSSLSRLEKKKKKNR